VLVLTRSELVGMLSTATVAAISGTIRNVPSQVALGPEQGLPKACAANLNSVFTIDRSELGPYIAALPDETMGRVDAALVFALGVGERSSPREFH